MILCAHSNENHCSPCTTIKDFRNSSCFNVNEGGSGLLIGNKWELEYPKAGNGNENEVVGMGGNGSFPHISL